MSLVVDVMKDASKHRANRIIFESDSDDDTAAIDDLIHAVKPVQSEKQVSASTHFAYACIKMSTKCSENT